MLKRSTVAAQQTWDQWVQRQKCVALVKELSEREHTATLSGPHPPPREQCKNQGRINLEVRTVGVGGGNNSEYCSKVRLYGWIWSLTLKMVVGNSSEMSVIFKFCDGEHNTTQHNTTQKHFHGDYKSYNIERNVTGLDYELTRSAVFKCDIPSWFKYTKIGRLQSVTAVFLQ